MLRGITIRFARRISFRSKEFRGVDHRRKGKKLSARSLGMERLVRIEQVLYHRCDYNGEGAACIRISPSFVRA